MKTGFIDSNLIVYANDGRETEKQSRALELLQTMMTAGCGVMSTQVLQEYANVALTKLHQESLVILRQIRLLENFHIELITPENTSVNHAASPPCPVPVCVRRTGRHRARWG